MNISYKWLKNYINLSDTPEEVAKILTSIGLEVGTVEKVETIRGGLNGLVVAQVLTCEAHPNSDHLHITTVRLAEGDEPVQIVCGAPNVAAGQKVICATLGTVLYSGEESFTIKKSKIRGVESFGMLCAEDEIGVGTSHDGIIVLPEDTKVGTSAKEYYNVEDDYVIEVDITPNRADAISHYGVARDLYAYYHSHGHTDIHLNKPSVEDFKVDNHELTVAVEVENADACPRYSGVTISGVTIAESPDWLKTALLSIGLRPINNVVDATNYVLHEMGQALHAFDADKIKGNKIIVKNVAAGTPFVTLDEVERQLDAADLMICNVQEPMCIAGVFGGLDSGVSNSTKNIFLESAYFNPVTIRKTARRHGLQTDASFRYERGCDPNNTIYVLKRCATLIQQVAGGKIAMDIVDIKNDEFAPFEVSLSLSEIHSLIGKELGAELVETILASLEIQIAEKKITGSDVQYKLLVPRYRVDVQRGCDVVEDILRIYGYNNIEFPEKVNTNLVYSQKPDSTFWTRRISELLTAQGFNEILNNSLTKTSYYDRLEAYPFAQCVKLLNPLSADLAVMRQTLLFGGLESIQRNVNRRNSNLKFYEFGNCYHYNKPSDAAEPISAYTEEPHLALWLTGQKTAQSWAEQQKEVSFYQMRAYVENIFRRVGLNIEKLTLSEFSNELYTEGLKYILPTGKELCYIGAVTRNLRKQFDIDGAAYFADINWQLLLKEQKKYKPVIADLPRFPEVRRDLALLIDKQVRFADLKQAAMQTEKKLLKDVFLFDVYEGKTLDIGKKSYALAFILQDENNTLKDQQIDFIMQRLQKMFEQQFGAKLR